MNRTPRLLAAAAAAVMAAPALAATATLTERESFSHITLTAGNGPSSVTFADGALTPVTSLHSAPIVVAGADAGENSALVYYTSFAASWDQRQDFSFQTVGSDAVLNASGALGVTMSSTWFNAASGTGGSPATQYYSSTNWQAFEFVLDESTAFSFTGATASQSLQMYRWLNDGWVTAAYVISPGSGASFSNSGVMEAGRYLLRNTPVTILSIQTAVTGNSWDYTLTLHDTVAAVPEPATVASMLAGLAAIGWRLRRRSPL